MLAVARARRQLPVAEADMRQLPFGAGAMALVVAFYSIQHVPRHELRDVLVRWRECCGPVVHC